MKNFISGLKTGLKNFGSTISIIINTILLLVVYIIGIGLTSLVAKLSGKHFLDLKIDKNKKSYWRDLNLTKQPFENYFRQF